MKRMLHLFAVFALVAIAGCAQVQAQLDKNVQTVTIPDLTTALADATAAGNTGGETCWSGLITYINALPTAGASSTLPALGGVATALELGSELAAAPPNLVTLPPLPRPVHDACAGILLDDANLLAKFGITVTTVGKGLGIAKELKAAAAIRP